MSNTRQTILASRLAAMILALTLVVGLTAPALMLPRAQAAPSAPPPLPCTQGNHNGCTELSPVPPEDTASVPPNIVLMLDDSGSMNWDYMPDWGYLVRNSNQGARDWRNNSLYYNPTFNFTDTASTAGYQPPPKADGSSYLPSPGLTNAYNDGFLDATAKNVTAYSSSNPGGQNLTYYTAFNTNTKTDVGPATHYCANNYHDDGTQCVPNSLTPPTSNKSWQCPNPPGGSLDTTTSPYTCHKQVGETWVVLGKAVYQCPANYTWSDSQNKCIGPVPQSVAWSWKCPNPPGGTATWVGAEVRCIITDTTSIKVFTIDVPQFNARTGAFSSYLDYYIAAGTDCSNIPAANQPRCVNEDDTTGKFPDGTISGPPGVPVGQNVANWFSYYRTRLLFAKTGLMQAFINLDPKYRFGFASINANGVSNIPSSPEAPYGFNNYYSGFPGGGSSSNKLAVVQPFGDGSSDTQKAKFWNWIAKESASNGTPLRKALQAVGEYYKTDQPWSTMPGDPGYGPGSNTKFACRASYTILTTDGFWNGADPSGIGYAAGSDGAVWSVPSGNLSQYKAVPPFSGGRVGGSVPSLADVATYYWENDLRTDIGNEVAASTSDPASWQHMTTFTIGLGFTPTGIQPAGTTIQQIFGWAHAVDAGTSPNPTPADFSWPTPSSNNISNIADLAHAAVNGHGDFFNVTKPADLADAFGKLLADIGARTIPPTPSAVNASVLSLGALSFSTGYDTGKWIGTFQAVTLKTDGTTGQVLWKAGDNLNADFHTATGYTNRNVYTGAYDSTKPAPFSAFKFSAANKASLDATETAGLGDPLYAAGDDKIENRINYLLGDPTYEGTLYRTRDSILGAIIRSEPVYVAGATGNYYSTWPNFGGDTPPENASGAQSYDAFVAQASIRAGMVYVGANDGMLHAFTAPVPKCSGTPDADGNCPATAYTFPTGSNPGHEAWAFIPRAVYANLGNLTNAADFQFRPTADATPMTRDVFFSQGTRTPDNQWHTILVGGVGLGGRGAYALDVTNPTSFSASSVLWEFDADMTPAPDCFASYGNCKATDLGYTLSKPNIGRLRYNNKWAVLVPNGYFPDCTTPDMPTGTAAACQAIAAQAPMDGGKPYSALFVLDAETGKMIAELKTPTGISGVTSFGLATPVLGDYENDRVDDVAFAGDVQGNLWRFDLSYASVANWTVTLVYKGAGSGGIQGLQPITSMPRLFPDPTTNRFMVVFGTGKFLGIGDNSDNTVQAVYGVRDVVGKTWTQSDLARQYLHETIAAAMLPDGTTPNPNAGATLRCVTGGASDTCDAPTPANTVPAGSGGWFMNLYTTTSDGTRNDAGERVVVTPAAIFSSNTAVIGTLITGSQTTDACNPSTQGSILALNALSGGSGGVSSLGGGGIAGGRIDNAHTSGSLALVSAQGGGRYLVPGTALSGVSGLAGKKPIGGDQPVWRRRSWQEINQNQ